MEAQAQAIEGQVLELVGDFTSVGEWLAKAIPLTLLLSVFLAWHGAGLLILAWHSFMLLRTSHLLVAECRRSPAERDTRRALAVLFVAVLHSLIIAAEDFSSLRRADSIRLMPVPVEDFWDALWLVCLNDVFARFVGIAIKTCVLIGYPDTSKRKKGLLLSAVEAAVLYYRVCLPAPVWLRFYLQLQGRLWTPFVATVICVYAVYKLASAVRTGYRMLQAFGDYLKGSLPFGSLPSQEELLEAGSECSICRDHMSAPLKLTCGHIFCEDCVTEWFHRKNTCPLCRSVVRTGSGRRSHGDGSTNMMLYIF
mmetsp:Transcript_10935/g.44732  ORF Transcript_10935/g.44732 Transcript_10935/m.44732 type:complete len:309 (+) Transcript_10935:3-929(+)